MTQTLCYFIGSKNVHFNVEQAVLNEGQMLSDAFNLELLTTAPLEFKEEAEQYFDIYGAQESCSRRGELKIIAQSVRRASPSAFLQVTDAPVHGNIAGAAARLTDAKFVYRYNGDAFYFYKVNSGWKKGAHFARNNLAGRLPLELADECIVMGENGRQRLTRRGVSRDQITVLPPVIDRTRFELDESDSDDILEKFEIPLEKSIVLFVGRLIPTKGIHTLESIIPQLLDVREDLHFVLAGHRDQSLSIPDSYAESVTLTGPVSPNEIPALFHAADVLVHPSLSEGVPRVLLEALLTGTPVIAREVGDVSAVTDNLFESEDELVEMVLNFEDLLVDDAKQFCLENAQSKYTSFWEAVL